jgi:hypothetical protein
MIRRTRFLIFLSIILGSSILLGLSAFYQIDTYRSLTFTYEITEVAVSQNETSGEFRRISVSLRIYNPALTLPIDLIRTDTHVFLNGQPLDQGFGFKGGRTLILRGEYRSFTWQYSLRESDQQLFQAANSSGNWNWFFFFEPLVQATFMAETNNGRLEVYRSVFYFGASVVPL